MKTDHFPYWALQQENKLTVMMVRSCKRCFVVQLKNAFHNAVATKMHKHRILYNLKLCRLLHVTLVTCSENGSEGLPPELIKL